MPGATRRKKSPGDGRQPRNRSRDRSQARRGRVRHRGELLQQPRRNRGRSVPRFAGWEGEPSRSRAASASPRAWRRAVRGTAPSISTGSTSSSSNAASGVLKPALEMTLKHWRWCLETNALALNLLAQRAVADDARRRTHHRAVEPGRCARDARATASSAPPRRRWSRWCARWRRSSARAESASTR